MKNLKKFVCNLDVIISGLSLCAIVVITLAGVIMRKIMNQPIAWLEEMQLLLFIYAIFFGGSVAFRYGNQVSIVCALYSGKTDTGHCLFLKAIKRRCENG